MKIICLTVLLTGLIFFSISSATTATTPNQELLQIRTFIQQEVMSWNSGNTKEFMKSYKDSPKTIYISSSIIIGYQNILKRYLTTYPTSDNMGQLSYKLINIKLLSPQYAFVIGQWNLVRGKTSRGNISGFFTLLLEKISNQWKIVVDHTTVN